MITTDYQRLLIVENVAFLEYSKKLQPLYTLPSRKLLTTKLLPDQYNTIYLKLKCMTENVNFVSITTDMWTSDSTRSYITVTCHFIHDDNLYSTVLATKFVIVIREKTLLRFFHIFLPNGILLIKLYQ